MSKQLRLLMICGDYPPALSGVGDYVGILCDHLADECGLEVTLLTTAGDPLPSDRDRPFRVMRAMPDWSLKNRKRAIELAQDFDLVHMQYPSVRYGRGPAVNLLPAMIRLGAGVPTIVTIHDFRVMRKRWRARVVPMLAAASGLIHVDGGDGPFLRRWSPFLHPPMKCIPIASNAPVLERSDERRREWRKQLGLHKDDIAVAYFGILYPHKGVGELLDAVDSLRNFGHRLRPIIIGDFDREADYVESMTRRFTSNDKTIWVRGASLERVSECLHAADVAALPFHSGASFNRSSMLACLQHGLPTITTNGPATPANLKDVYDLLLVPPKESAELAKALRQLITDPTLRERMRQNVLRQSADLNWPAVARAHAEFYRQIAFKPVEEAAARIHANPQRS